MTASAVITSFVPAGLDVADVAQLEPLYQELLDRPVASARELEQWLADFSELHEAVDECLNRRYVQKSCDTTDPALEHAYLQFITEVEPKIRPLLAQLQRKFVESPHRADLPGRRYHMLNRKWQVDVELFREENVPLEMEVLKLVNEYDKITAGMTIQWRGEEQTLQQAGLLIEEPDRAMREEVWKLIAARRQRERQRLDDLFDRLLVLRTRIARNAGLSDCRAYMWKVYKRFDYTPDDAFRFAEAIEKWCVPLMRRLERERREQLGVPALRPWDLQVDPKGRRPLRPCDGIPDLIEKAATAIRRVSPELGADFDMLRRNGLLDIDSRKGKQPGAYQAQLEQSRVPFIFMNAAGQQVDVETLLHEAGHAFHFLAACRAEPLLFLRSPTMEFAEVASMSMELLGMEHLDVFYDDADDARRARRKCFEDIVCFLPWMAAVVLFQHWIYTNPGHTREERTRRWTALLDRFGRDIDWSGFEHVREQSWQNQVHIFQVPFYFIEYGMAQLGALQLWLRSRHDPHRTLANYRSALRLGGTRPIPELFAAAGIAFDFSERTIRPLMDAVAEELNALG